MTLYDEELVDKTIRQVQAILGEVQVEPRTGRTLPDLGRVPEGATIASLIDHVLLQPDATARQVENLCFQAKEFGFASVCINSVYVPLVKELLKDSGVRICTMVGFPLGASLPQVKVYEADEAIQRGAQEIEMVTHIGAVKNRDLVALHEDISDVAVVCHENNLICTVIIETPLLTEEEKVIACQVARMAGADFVKTATGFNGASTTADVALVRRVVGTGLGVKASGGVASLAEAQAVIKAGANRIGTNAGVTVARQERGETLPV